jgi:hypothetical protein
MKNLCALCFAAVAASMGMALTTAPAYGQVLLEGNH